MYLIIDLKTKTPVGRKCKTRKGAQRSADRRNLEYGAHRYYVTKLSGSPWVSI